MNVYIIWKHSKKAPFTRSIYSIKSTEKSAEGEIQELVPCHHNSLYRYYIEQQKVEE